MTRILQIFTDFKIHSIFVKNCRVKAYDLIQMLNRFLAAARRRSDRGVFNNLF